MRLRPSSGWPGRITTPQRRGPRRGTFHLAKAQFSPSLPDGGRGGTAAFGPDDSGPTDEGRKDAAEGRKESVNDGPRARDLGLASVSSASLEGPAEAATESSNGDRRFLNGDDMGVLVYI